jgi:hypothetical protein
MHYQRWRAHGDPSVLGDKGRGVRTHGEVCLVDGKRVASPEYRAWQGMRDRVLNNESKNYPYYGGRGIVICARWNDYQNFLSDMGRKPSAGHTLDRKDNDGNYTPKNCRWATRAEQSRNRRPFSMEGKSPLTKAITVFGVTKTITEWARDRGMERERLRGRLKSGWKPERALTQAVISKARRLA